MIRITTHAVSIVLLCLPVAASAQSLTPTVIARIGDTAPGTSGQTYTVLAELPRLGANGHVAFQGLITGPSSMDNGFWAGTPGNLQLAMRKDSATFGGMTVATSITNLGIDANGGVSMWTQQNVAINQDQRLWSYLPNGNGGNTLVGAEGTTVAPGFAGGTFSSFGAGQAANNSGAVAFVGSVAGGDVTSSSDQGLFAGTPGNLKLVARKGATATGATGPSPVFSTTFGPFFDKRINTSGQVAFGAALAGTDVGANRAIYVWDPAGSGTLNLTAQTGSTAPGLGSSTITFQSMDDSPGFNDAGQVAFRAFVAGSPTDGLNLVNNIAIWAGSTGNLQVIARSASPSPIAGLQYRAMDQYPRINDSGQVAFISLLGPSVPSTSDRALWISTPTGVQLVAREGSPAPGASLDNSVLYDSLENAPPAINNAGQVAFTARLVLGAGVTVDNDRGLWAGSPGHVSLIAREGDVIDIDAGPGVLNRTVSSFSFATDTLVSGGTNFSSADAAFNDAGQIAWRAAFVGGESAIFRTTLPTISTPILPGDYNDDDVVDVRDYVVWRKFNDTSHPLPNDPNPLPIDGDQYTTWVQNFGRSLSGGGGDSSHPGAPEPNSLLLFVIGGIVASTTRRVAR